MGKGQYYQRVMSIASIMYVIVMFLTGWNETAVAVGALLLGLIAVAGTWFAKDETPT
ncbi:MAG: hypothetical protein ACR2OU_15495 [Thermomicrobiales bacterium]